MHALILSVTLVVYDVEFFATLYNFIDRVESGGEQHCIILIDTVYLSVGNTLHQAGRVERGGEQHCIILMVTVYHSV